MISPDSGHRISDARGIGDINGDGYDDLLVSFTSYCNIYFGGDPFDLIPDITFSNGFFEVPGDVNNDNYADVIIRYRDSFGYYFELYFGGPEVDTIADFTFRPPIYGNDLYSNYVREIGDVNNDGYNDFIISCFENFPDSKGRVFLFYGGETIHKDPDITFISGSQDVCYGIIVSGIGDFNRDGYDDIMITTGIRHAQDEYSIVYLYYGGAEMDTTADRIYMPSYDEPLFGNYIINAGDINGDQCNDFIISSLAFTYFYLNLDSVTVFPHYQYAISGIEGGGDINNDGFNDFIMSSETYPNDKDLAVGAAFIFYGDSILDFDYDQKIEGTIPLGYFSTPSYIIGDINNDNYDDVIFLETGDNRSGRLYLYSYKNLAINSVNPINNTVPQEVSLLQNYPNPFNPSTTITYHVPKLSNIELSIYNLLGQKVATLVSEKQHAGQYQVQWDATGFAGGIYFYRLVTDTGFSQARKLLYLK